MGIENFLSSGNVRLDQQLKFTAEIDKMTGILRRTVLIDKSRRENDAEHSWHIAAMAMLFEEYAVEPVNVSRAVMMCVVHDLIEIYAGDTFAYDVKANQDKADREKLAADKLFNLLPEEQGTMIRNLWEEFDAMETPDAKYAACMDRLQPFLHNTLTDGFTWVESGTSRAVVEKRMAVIKSFMPRVYEWIEDNIERAIERGWLKDSKKVLLFDLDGTLLKTDKTISDRTVEAVLSAREKGYIIGVSTSRSESNSRSFIHRLSPDIIISSGGALVSLNGEKIIVEDPEFIFVVLQGDDSRRSEVVEQLKPLMAQRPRGQQLREILFVQDPLPRTATDEKKAEELEKALVNCDFIHFTDGDWYKVTKAGITKETAIRKLSEKIGVGLENITAFGDDLADIGSLKMCGTGVAMGNALDVVKEAADVIIGSNDEDGIAEYLEELL